MSFEFEVVAPSPLDPAAEQHMVPMRDGVHLATDVYLPDRAGEVPAVLVRLPYDKGGRYTFMSQVAPAFTARGYAFVVQDVRGKFRSEGETVAFVHEIDDGYDTLEWVASQAWCDGSVGMWGDSYYGYTQWAAVASEHPALKAIVPRVTSADLGGPFGADAVIPLYMGEYLAMYWLDDAIYHWRTDYGHRPLSGVFDEAFDAIGRRAEAFDRFVARSAMGQGLMTYPGPHPFDVLRIPVLHTGGWFDNIMPDQMRDYEALIARPEVADLQYLEMNSTDHENYHLDLVPVRPEDDHDVDDGALARMLSVYVGSAIDFFDRFLKGDEVEIRGCAGTSGTKGGGAPRRGRLRAPGSSGCTSRRPTAPSATSTEAVWPWSPMPRRRSHGGCTTRPISSPRRWPTRSRSCVPCPTSGAWATVPTCSRSPRRRSTGRSTWWVPCRCWSGSAPQRRRRPCSRSSSMSTPMARR